MTTVEYVDEGTLALQDQWSEFNPATLSDLFTLCEVVGSITEYVERFEAHGATLETLMAKGQTLSNLERLGMDMHCDRVKVHDMLRAQRLLLRPEEDDRGASEQGLSSLWMFPRKYDQPDPPSALEARPPFGTVASPDDEGDAPQE
uniref:SAM domain-containing protein n=1 Tax=Oxyrrhis marina TaxID=2969 RepID=A0A6U9K9N2_OXYMA